MNDPALSNLFNVPEVLSFRDAVAALIVLEDGRYLMQLRDDKPGIFYPNHWGLFGGAIEDGEDAETALRREVKEEIGFDAGTAVFFTRMDFDFESIGAKRAKRVFYELRMKPADLDGLVLTEGRSLEAIAPEDLLINRRVVPYDSFAVWMHHCSRRDLWAANNVNSN